MPPVQPREKDVYDIDSDQDDTDKTRSAAVMARTLDRVATAQMRPRDAQQAPPAQQAPIYPELTTLPANATQIARAIFALPEVRPL